MLDAWKVLAASEQFMLAAPDSLDAAVWDSKYDSPAFLHAVVAQVGAMHAVDPQRIYLFGHSGGAVYALALALIDSDYYAATAVHAGALPDQSHRLFPYATRHMPVALWVGDHDPAFGIDRVTETRDLFKAQGFDVQLSILKSHGHEYSEVAETVNRQAWTFFQGASLPDAQKAE